MARPCWRQWGRFSSGFTLIELLVAISILALMAVLSWRGLDGMAQTQSRLQQRADEVLALQAGLAQWGADLDALVELAGQPALDWDGRALRLTRTASVAAAAAAGPAGATGALGAGGAVTVIAWSRREVQGAGQWLRWQSPPLQTRAALQTAWAAAAQWAQNPGDDLKAREDYIAPLAQWQIYSFRNDAWTNPLSAAGSAAVTPPAGAAGGVTGAAGGVAGAVASAMAALAASLPSANAGAPIPQGVRLVLTLPPGQAISGALTRDWVLPTLGGGKS